MHKSTTALASTQINRSAIDFRQPQLDLRGKGKVSATVLFAAVARTSSIHETCDRLDTAPRETAYAIALYANLSGLE